MAKANLKKKLQYWGTGRRKKAIARVRLIPSGSGAIVINDRTLEDYFPMGTLQYIVKQPLVEVAAEGKYDIFVNVSASASQGRFCRASPKFAPPSRRQASSPATPASRSARSTASRRRAEHLSSRRDKKVFAKIFFVPKNLSARIQQG